MSSASCGRSLLDNKVIVRVLLSFVSSLLFATFVCERCRKETKFLPIPFAVVLADVSRSTLYRWMDREWIHWRELPSSRRLICLESLIQIHQVDTLLLSALSDNARSRWT
jgi:predicted DNA-binding transcriptional regulator AlpA